jgi:hypothetical protein
VVEGAGAVAGVEVELAALVDRGDIVELVGVVVGAGGVGVQAPGGPGAMMLSRVQRLAR